MNRDNKEERTQELTVSDLVETTDPPPVDKPSGSGDELPPGTVIDGRYRVESLIGIGAMGAVYEVTHLKLNKSFALKMVVKDLSFKKEFRDRFEREARVCSLLDHPNCISVTDFGHTAQGRHFLVMELVDGIPLSSVVDKAPLPLSEALDVTRQMLAGLQHAHSRGLIHRDIKLENVLLCELEDHTRLVKILDFGMAIPPADAQEDMSITRRGVVMGTPNYIAPEVLNGEPASEVSDLYGVGVSLARMLTGKPLFTGKTMVDIFTAKRKKPAPWLSEVAGKPFPRAVELFVHRALRRRPADRFQTSKEMLEALAGLEKQLAGAPRRRRWMMVSGLVLVGFLVLGGFIAARMKITPSATASSIPAAAPSPPEHNKTHPNPKVDTASSPSSSPVLMEARILLEQHRCQKAQKMLEEHLNQLGPKRAEGHFLLGRAALCNKTPQITLAQYLAAMEADSAYGKNTTLINDVVALLASKTHRTAALDLLCGPLANGALPILVRLAGRHPKKEIRHAALDAVTRLGMRDRVNLAASLDWDLNQTGRCDEKRKIVNQLALLGSWRARQILLRAKSAEVKEGLFRRRKKHGCVMKDINKALATIGHPADEPKP